MRARMSVGRPQVFGRGCWLDGHDLGHAQLEHELCVLIGVRRLVDGTAEVRHGAADRAALGGDAGRVVQ
jgi:hypothetical protein